MPIESVDDVSDSVDDIQIRVTAAAAYSEIEIISSDTARNIQATMEGVTGDGLALVRDLDTTNEEDLLVVQDGAATIELWRWRRTVRREVMGLLGTARQIGDLVDGLVEGAPAKVIVTRYGDTLQRIAARELGGWREWPRLLEANPGISPGAIASGTSLIIPEG